MRGTIGCGNGAGLDRHAAACAFPAAGNRAFPPARRPNHDPETFHAPLSQPYLWRPRARRCRPVRASFRMGPSGARSRRPAVHRPARPLRPDPVRRRPQLAGLQRGRAGALGMGDPHRRHGEGAHAGNRQPQPADGRRGSLHRRAGGAVGGGRAADAGLRRPRLSGGDAAQVPLPRPQARQAPPQHHEAGGDHFVAAPAHDGVRLLRVPDADPDRILARKARATSWCPRGSIPASSTPCRRRRSSSSSSS